jgi:hypothetical protein
MGETSGRENFGAGPGRERKEVGSRAEAGSRGHPRTSPPSFDFHFDLVASLTPMQIIKITIDVSISYNLQSDYI